MLTEKFFRVREFDKARSYSMPCMCSHQDTWIAAAYKLTNIGSISSFRRIPVYAKSYDEAVNKAKTKANEKDIVLVIAQLYAKRTEFPTDKAYVYISKDTQQIHVDKLP